MIVSASVLFPEPFGPMIACTSPLFTTRSIPLRIVLPSTSTRRSLISRSGMSGLPCGRLSRQVFETHAVQRLRDRALQGHPDVVGRAARLQHTIHDGLTFGGADLR